MEGSDNNNVMVIIDYNHYNNDPSKDHYGFISECLLFRYTTFRQVPGFAGQGIQNRQVTLHLKSDGSIIIID